MAACAFPEPATLSYDILLRWALLLLIQSDSAADSFLEAGFCHTLISMVCCTSWERVLVMQAKNAPQSNPIIL